MANGAGNTRQRVEAPPVTPSPFGLFSAATVNDDGGSGAQGGSGLRWVLSGITWEPAYCGPAYVTEGACLDADALTVEDGIDAVEALPFTAYHLHRCRLPGRDWTTGDQRAAEALRLGEQRAAEAVLWQGMADADALEVLGGGAVHPVEAMGLLEDHLGANYGGVGVIHAAPSTATLLTSYGLLERVGTGQQSKATGTRVAVGGGYLPGRLYATGQVMVRRTSAAEVMRSAAGDLTTNQYVALAQRPYVIGWECVTATVEAVTGYGVPT